MTKNCDIQSHAGIQKQDESHTKSKAGGTSESQSLGEDDERKGKVGAVSKPRGMKSEGRTRLKKKKSRGISIHLMIYIELA